MYALYAILRPEIWHAMKVAVIDMGTNTFHLIIVEVEKDDFKIIYREKTAVKIGEKGINHGMITDDAIDRALKTLTKFKEVIEEEQVEQVFATATSAIRNAAVYLIAKLIIYTERLRIGPHLGMHCVEPTSMVSSGCSAPS